MQEAPLVAAAYHAGAVLLDCCKQYGPLPTELHQAQLRALTRSRALARALSASLPLNPSPNPSPSPSTNPSPSLALALALTQTQALAQSLTPNQVR